MSNQWLMTGAGVVVLTIGGLLGYVAAATFQEPQEVIYEPQTIQAEISDEDLEELCSKLTDVQKKNVLEVQKEVKSLQQQIADREVELDRLRVQMQKDKSSKAQAQKKWKAMEAEIATLQVQLAAAEQERDSLKVELQETLVELKKQVKETQKFKSKAKKYKVQSTTNLWTAFQAQAKVKGCDRGSRKRHERCHDAFDLAMTSKVQQRFFNCVDTYQAVPVLRKLARGEELPNHSVYVNTESRFTDNWVIIFCDPTLPEARDTDLDDDPPPREPEIYEPEEEYELDEEMDLDFDLDLDD